MILNSDYLLLSKFIIFNSLCWFIVFYIHQLGWLTKLVFSDITFISQGIAFLFLLGWVVSLFWAYIISKEFKEVKKGNITFLIKKFYSHDVDFSEARNQESLKLFLSTRIAWIRTIAWMLVMIGLIGTGVGFTHLLLNLNFADLLNPSTIAAASTVLNHGLGTALYANIVGASTNLWLLYNYYMIENAVANMYGYFLSYVKK